MYELSFWVDGFKEDVISFETLEEAVREFGSWIDGYAREVRKRGDYMQGATIKIQKMEDVVSVNL